MRQLFSERCCFQWFMQRRNRPIRLTQSSRYRLQMCSMQILGIKIFRSKYFHHFKLWMPHYHATNTKNLNPYTILGTTQSNRSILKSIELAGGPPDTFASFRNDCGSAKKNAIWNNHLRSWDHFTIIPSFLILQLKRSKLQPNCKERRWN